LLVALVIEVIDVIEKLLFIHYRFLPQAEHLFGWQLYTTMRTFSKVDNITICAVT
jgi:hypothetical protein